MGAEFSFAIFHLMLLHLHSSEYIATLRFAQIALSGNFIYPQNVRRHKSHRR